MVPTQATSGDDKWTFAIGTLIEVSPAVTRGGTVDSYSALDAEGTLYIGTSTGEFYAIGGH